MITLRIQKGNCKFSKCYWSML